MLEKIAQAVQNNDFVTLSQLISSEQAEDISDSLPICLSVLCKNTEILELLLLNGGNANQVDEQGRTPLGVAAENGNLAAIEILLFCEAEINLADQTGRTPVLYAAQAGHLEIVQFLTQSGADTEILSPSGRTPLMEALVHGHEEVAQALISVTDTLQAPDSEENKLNQRDEEGFNPLILAVLQGDADLVNELIEQGVNLNSQDLDGKTALMHAVAMGENEQGEKILKNKLTDLFDQSAQSVSGGDAHAFDEEAIHVAGSADSVQNEDILNVAGSGESHQNEEVIKVEGADGDVQDEEAVKVKGTRENILDTSKTKIKGTPEKYDEIIKILVKAQANVDLKDKKGRNAFDLTKEYNRPTFLTTMKTAMSEPSKKTRFLQRLQLKTSGKDVEDADALAENMRKESTVSAINARNKKGQTALVIASMKGMYDMVESLLSKGADVNAKDFKGFTPLMGAAICGNELMAQALIKHGARIDSKNEEGCTPLVFSVMRSHLGVAQILLQEKANVQIRIKGATLLMFAAAKGNEMLVRLLLEHGADLSLKDYKGKTAIDYARTNKFEELADFLFEEKLKNKKVKI